jgi:hypothetical protein
VRRTVQEATSVDLNKEFENRIDPGGEIKSALQAPLVDEAVVKHVPPSTEPVIEAQPAPEGDPPLHDAPRIPPAP